MEPRTRSLIAVDTGDFEKSFKVINEIEKRNKAELRYILSTHHHGDHVGGNLQWK
jgi:glyoxylase-like metal-dependent hydrolase (beta-lactamase superfamily II)